MDFGATVNTSELEGSHAAASVCANLSHTRLACCSLIGTISTYQKEGAGWRLLTTWKLPHGAAVKVIFTCSPYHIPCNSTSWTGAVFLPFRHVTLHWIPMQAVWAHPEHGAVLAVLSDSGTMTIFSECQSQGGTSMQMVASLSSQHVTSLDFGPRELGLQIATVSLDGIVRCGT